MTSSSTTILWREDLVQDTVHSLIIMYCITLPYSLFVGGPLAYLSGTQARHSTSKFDPKWRIQERQIPPLNGVTYYKSCP